jgi:hypothetical protein
MAKPKVGPKEFLILNNMRDRKMPRITRQLFSQVKEFHRGPLSKFRKMTKKKRRRRKVCVCNWVQTPNPCPISFCRMLGGR